MLIGLTGRSGSGKSTVSRFFREAGFDIIDCDEIVHTLYKDPRYAAKIAENFGASCLKDGKVDRAALSAIVFSDSEKLKKLNEIASVFIMEAVMAAITLAKKSTRDTVLDAPLLFEYGLEKTCDLTLSVVCDTETAVRRLLLRDGRSEAEIRARLAAQKDIAFFRERSDMILENNGGREALREAFNLVLSEIRANTQ